MALPAQGRPKRAVSDHGAPSLEILNRAQASFADYDRRMKGEARLGGGSALFLP